MSDFNIPQDWYDTTPRSGLFPEGNFVGTIEESTGGYLRDLDWEPPQTRLSIQIGDIGSMVDDEAGVGARKYWADLTVNYDGADFNGDDLPVQLNIAAQRLVELARSIGYIQEGDPSFDINAFVDAIVAGDFEGMEVGFRTYHKPYTNKAGEKKTACNLGNFLPAE